jgi:hypothetical protein
MLLRSGLDTGKEAVAARVLAIRERIDREQDECAARVQGFATLEEAEIYWEKPWWEKPSHRPQPLFVGCPCPRRCSCCGPEFLTAQEAAAAAAAGYKVG